MAASDANPNHKEGQSKSSSVVSATGSGENVDQSDVVTVRELLGVIMEKDRLLSDLLRRLSTSTPIGPEATQDVTTFQVMPDLSKNFVNFEATEGAASAKEWLENLRRTSTLHKWPASFLLETAKCRLTGTAKDWLRAHNAEITSWKDFEDRFRRTLVSQHEQRNDGGVCRNASSREVKALRPTFNLRQLSTMLLGKTHDDEDDLLHDIQEFERIDRERQERFGSTRDKKTVVNALRATDTATTTIRKAIDERDNKDRRPPVSNEKGERKSYNCNQYGHMARDCPQTKRPMKCLRCNGTDHTQRHCKEGVMTERTEANTVSQPTDETKHAGVLLKEVILNEEFPLIGLVDTGSSGCLLRASAAARCGTELIRESPPLYGFGNSSEPVTKSIGRCKANIEIDGVVARDIPILVVPDEAQTVDLLIGRTFTELPYLTYARVGGCLRFWHQNDCPFAHLEPFDVQQKLQMRAKEESNLQKDRVNWITLTTEQRLTGPVVYRHCGQDVLVDMTLGEVTLPMCAAGDHDAIIKKGQPLGRAEQIEVFKVDAMDQQEVTTVRQPILMTEVNVGPTVTELQHTELVETLNMFRECFAMTPSELGCTSVMKMNIVEVPGSTPVSVRPYRTNAEGRETIRKIVSEWKNLGLVTETDSDYASPVLVVDKKNGEKRLVVDYRRLNAQTVKEKYPLPNIDDQFEGLAGAMLYTVLDLAHGYLQVPLTESAKRKTAFITPDETGQFEGMMFGLTNAPSVFQRLMNKVLGPLRGQVVMCYLDDVLIPAQDWSDMIRRLRQVLHAFRGANLTLRLSKCVFAKDSVEYLCFRLTSGQMQPGEAKYAMIAEPLTRLTRKDTDFDWGAEQESCFQYLKESLTTKPVLQLFDPKSETELHTDASSKGLAGMLLQQKGNKWHLVYCVSKKTTETESNYHSTRLELMAIVWCVDRLRSLLLGIHFTVVTDCQALVYLNAQRAQKPQIARWYDLIQEFDFSIKHRPGSQMLHVDSLSRGPVDEPVDTMDSP
ncbi:uncharacterized protein LOC135374047 [Ornithodoros turicata]|uniref:uncharacterized protein LOC135374047 n=1 Tax=Ornithodoros turicata TaxID=34597 RepID=UPI00313A3144